MKASRLLLGLALGMLLLMLLPGSHSGMLFWLFLLVGLILVFLHASSDGENEQNNNEAPPTETHDQALLDTLTGEAMEITGTKRGKDGFLSYEGPLKIAPEEAVHRFESVCAKQGRNFYLERIDDRESRLVVFPPGSARDDVEPARKPRYILHWSLLVATFLTTTWVGAAHQGVDLLQEPGRFAVGLPYSLGLLLILGAHEMGHYFTARRYRINVTPPYFIPVPFGLGTFGAFISMRSIPQNRQALFDVAIAGPLAGLVFAVPALLIGLPLSAYVPAEASLGGLMGGGTSLGSSILLATLAKIALGSELAATHMVRLHPLAFAGWLGLFVTALNLLPIGQLDGGHIARALLGSRGAQTLSRYAMVAVFLLALFVWPGLLLFAILVFFMAGRPGIPLRNDVVQLTLSRRLLGYGALVLVLLIALPLPHNLYQNFGLHCPYL